MGKCYAVHHPSVPRMPGDKTGCDAGTVTIRIYICARLRKPRGGIYKPGAANATHSVPNRSSGSSRRRRQVCTSGFTQSVVCSRRRAACFPRASLRESIRELCPRRTSTSTSTSTTITTSTSSPRMAVSREASARLSPIPITLTRAAIPERFSPSWWTPSITSGKPARARRNPQVRRRAVRAFLSRAILRGGSCEYIHSSLLFKKRRHSNHSALWFLKHPLFISTENDISKSGIFVRDLFRQVGKSYGLNFSSKQNITSNNKKKSKQFLSLVLLYSVFFLLHASLWLRFTNRISALDIFILVFQCKLSDAKGQVAHCVLFSLSGRITSRVTIRTSPYMCLVIFFCRLHSLA